MRPNRGPRAQSSSASIAAARAAPSARHRAVGDLATDLLRDRVRDHRRRGGLEVHAPAGAVALEPVADVDGLLEVVLEREVEERPAVGGELHRGRQAALHDGEVAGREVLVEVVDERAHLQAVRGGEGRRIDARPGHDDHAQSGDERLRLGEARHHPAQQRPAHARAADGDQADLLAGAVAELVPELLAVGEGAGVEAGDVARVVEVRAGPVADRGQAGAEVLAHDVGLVADEDRAVAHAREAGDLLDHLRVVVGGELVLAASGALDGQPADEVGEPRVGGGLELRVLVQEVVELPRLVPDPQVVRIVAHDVGEDHEVRDEDLVHAPDGLEAVQVVLGGLRLDVRGLVREVGARRVDPLPARAEHRGDRVLREPVDLQVRMQRPQLVGDREVAARVAQPDGRRDEERAPAPAPRPAPPAGRGRGWRDQVAQEQVDLHGIAGDREVPRALERDQRPAGRGGQGGALSVRPDPVVVAVDHQGRAAHPRERGGERLRQRQLRAAVGVGQRLRRRLEPPADAVLDLLRAVRLAERLREEELEELAVVGRPVVPVELGPVLRRPQLHFEPVGLPRRVLPADRDGGRDVDDARHPLRMVRREPAGPQRAGGEADDRRALDADGVQHRQRVGGELADGVRLGALGPVRQPVAAAVEGDDPAVAGEVGDLRLPHARVHDRPRRQQDDGRPVRSVGLVRDPHAVALDVAARVGIPGARLLVRGARGGSVTRAPRERHGRASNTRLNGVSATRRNRVKPAASTTSRIRASPACAPSASPTSCESEAGVHSSVLNA